MFLRQEKEPSLPATDSGLVVRSRQLSCLLPVEAVDESNPQSTAHVKKNLNRNQGVVEDSDTVSIVIRSPVSWGEAGQPLAMVPRIPEPAYTDMGLRSLYSPRDRSTTLSPLRCS